MQNLLKLSCLALLLGAELPVWGQKKVVVKTEFLGEGCSGMPVMVTPIAEPGLCANGYTVQNCSLLMVHSKDDITCSSPPSSTIELTPEPSCFQDEVGNSFTLGCLEAPWFRYMVMEDGFDCSGKGGLRKNILSQDVKRVDWLRPNYCEPITQGQNKRSAKLETNGQDLRLHMFGDTNCTALLADKPVETSVCLAFEGENIVIVEVPNLDIATLTGFIIAILSTWKISPGAGAACANSCSNSYDGYRRLLGHVYNLKG